jgi:isopenicillin-N N-acyltransferase-like protein
MRFPEITISGSAEERGYAHGAALASQVEANIEFYASAFKKPTDEILAQARHFREVIRDYEPAYCQEIEGIAAGAGIREPLWIYALNARSEILALAPPESNECTALYFRPSAILGQNWDWARPAEDTTVLMQIQGARDLTIQMLAEPGILGKIGLNSHGIGVCLNILMVEKPLDGVPIHIVLRAVLESRTIEEAKAAIQRAGYGKASNILCADRQGNYLDVEFAGDEAFYLPTDGPTMVHTNHYLGQPINGEIENYPNSYRRFQVAQARAAALADFSLADMQAILSDRSDPEFPIWRAYQPDDELLEVGTVATIVMDLKAGELQVRKGNLKETDSRKGPTTIPIDDFYTAFKN